jgi:hypothetical protein
VGDKPGKYWDHRECAWVKCPAPADDMVVPAQGQPVESAEAEAEADGPTAARTTQ